jgi:hypothetical protein
LLELPFIVDMELMISRSSSLVKEGESQWTFGQTFAMLMVVVPVIETVKGVYKSWGDSGVVKD